MTAQVMAEMTATVWKILVKEGQAVTEDQDLLILESMKMEIPVSAESDGTVASIEIQEGSPVVEGDVLITLA